MDIEKIKKANTKIIGKEVIYFDTIQSTQEQAKHMAKERKLINGTIIIADNQTNGIGTKGRSWYTEKGNNITMSICIYPNCKIQKLDGITNKIAEAMKNAIKTLYKIDLVIKVPNDLILNGKKICGILTESATYNDKVEYLIIGVGFNVNEVVFTSEIADTATSLKREFGKNFNREEIIAAFIEEMERII